MANGDNLPYGPTDLDVVPFTPITSDWGDGVAADILALAAGTGLDDGSVPNLALKTGAGEPGGAWDSWTPTLTNLSGGTLNYAKYKVVGKTVHFKFKYTLAGAGVGGEIAFTPPVNLHADYNANNYLDGSATFYDVSVTTGYTGIIRVASVSSLNLRTIHTDGARATNQAASASNPTVFDTGDILYANGSYEMA